MAVARPALAGSTSSHAGSTRELMPAASIPTSGSALSLDDDEREPIVRPAGSSVDRATIELLIYGAPGR